MHHYFTIAFLFLFSLAIAFPIVDALDHSERDLLQSREEFSSALAIATETPISLDRGVELNITHIESSGRSLLMRFNANVGGLGIPGVFTGHVDEINIVDENYVFTFNTISSRIIMSSTFSVLSENRPFGAAYPDLGYDRDAKLKTFVSGYFASYSVLSDISSELSRRLQAPKTGRESFFFTSKVEMKDGAIMISSRPRNEIYYFAIFCLALAGLIQTNATLSHPARR